MRLALLALFLLAAGALMAATSGADTPARARAQAAVVSGSTGEFGALSVKGTHRKSADRVSVDAGRVLVGQATTVASSSTATGVANARAATLARDINLFDGLVTASAARRTATATGQGVVRGGRVARLTVEGRKIGDVAADRAYLLSDGSSVAVNRGTAALTLTLGQARGNAPAGTTIHVAVADASATNAVIAAPSPTPKPAATPKPKPKAKPKAKKNAWPKRKPAPQVPRRLTRQQYAFPVYGSASAADDYGAARADTGAHQGNDVFAPFGAPVLAVADGTVHRVGTLPISGNRLWLHTAAGDAFFYAHLSAFSPDAVDGRAVKAGTVLGFVGNTGDAEPTPPHLHFEIHPGGEVKPSIDPHAILLAWQQHKDVPPGAWLTRHGADTTQRPGALVEVRDFIAGG